MQATRRFLPAPPYHPRRDYSKTHRATIEKASANFLFFIFVSPENYDGWGCHSDPGLKEGGVPLQSILLPIFH
jgi:hypothetical protein